MMFDSEILIDDYQLQFQPLLKYFRKMTSPEQGLCDPPRETMSNNDERKEYRKVIQWLFFGYNNIQAGYVKFKRLGT